MANEATISFGFQFTKAGYRSITSNGNLRLTVAGGDSSGGVQTINTTDTMLTLSPDVSAPGLCVFENLDATNFILIGNDGSSYPIKLLPGDKFPLRFNGTIHAKADTAACKLGFDIIEP